MVMLGETIHAHAGAERSSRSATVRKNW